MIYASLLLDEPVGLLPMLLVVKLLTLLQCARCSLWWLQKQQLLDLKHLQVGRLEHCEPWLVQWAHCRWG